MCTVAVFHDSRFVVVVVVVVVVYFLLLLLFSRELRVHFVLRPQKRGGLLGAGTGGGVGGRGRKSEGSTADTARNRPERPWTAARTMEVH